MAKYAKILPYGAYVRMFQSSEYDKDAGKLLVDDFVMSRDCCDAMVITGGEPIPLSADARTFYIEGQSGPTGYQKVFRDSAGCPYFWGMSGGAVSDTIYLAMLQGGRSTASNANSYYYPLVTLDGESFGTTGQTVVRLAEDSITVYDSNPNYVSPEEERAALDPMLMSMGYGIGQRFKRRNET